MKTRSEPSDLWDLVPVMRRARGFRLYDRRGRRYLDLFLNRGAAVLGHRPFRLQAEIKNVISRGGLFEMPSVYPLRLARALGRAYPGFESVRLARDLSEAITLAARYLECGKDEIRLCDPALGERGRIVLDRPFLGESARSSALEAADVVIPVLPFDLGGSPCAMLFRGPAPAAEPGWLPPVVAASALRAFHDLARRQPAAWYSDDLLARCPAWVQRGIYVAPRFGAQHYRAVFVRFLAAGVLLPPAYPGPAVLPGEASPGELALLMRLFGEEVQCN